MEFRQTEIICRIGRQLFKPSIRERIDNALRNSATENSEA